MDSNKIKINYDPIERCTSFQFLGDNGQWGDVYEGSDLSRKKYSTAIADGRIGELLQIINDNYNVDENGVKIIFSGTDEVFNEVRSVIKEYEGMTLERCNSKVVVVGKRNSGKTYLVEGIFDFLERKICAVDKGGYIEYLDVQDGISIYEIKGIDLGLENVDKAYSFLENRIREGATTVFYCLFAKSGKIEETEISFIKKVESEYADINVIPVITGCVDEKRGSDFAHEIIDELGDRDVVLTLAKEMNTRVGVIQKFGMDNVIKKISEEGA